MSALFIRLASEADVPAVATLFDEYRVFHGQPSDPALARHFIRARILREESIILVAEVRDGPVLGFCQMLPSFCSLEAGPIGVLRDIYVAPVGRRLGVARALLMAARDHADQAGMARIDLTAPGDNQPAQALYESLGWARDELVRIHSLTLSASLREPLPRTPR